MRVFAAVVALFALVAGPAMARDLGTGVLPITIDAVEPLVLEADDEVRIEGVVEAASSVVVVLRIDDLKSWSYASRFNGERTLPPGPFRWTVAAKGLRTAEGRTLEYTKLRRVMFFLGAGEGKVTLARITRRDALKPCG